VINTLIGLLFCDIVTELSTYFEANATAFKAKAKAKKLASRPMPT